MSLLQEHSLVKKIKLFVYHTYWYQLKQSLANKYTKKIHFPGKMPICKDQPIDYFLLISNVPDFEKNVNSVSE